MSLTFAAATFDDHDIGHIMDINNRAMKELFKNPVEAEMLFDSLDNVRNFLANTIAVIVEFDETPIAYFRYYFVETNTMKLCHLGPLAILPEYNTHDVNQMISSFITHIAKNNICRYVLVETIESMEDSFINDGYVVYAEYSTSKKVYIMIPLQQLLIVLSKVLSHLRT